MSPRRGLTPQAVAAGALEVVDAEGVEGLTLSRVARHLGVAPPSLYNHVDGLDGLRRAAALTAIGELADALGGAVMGRAGEDALRAVARAFRAYAVARPGRYALTTQAEPDDPGFHAASMAPVAPVLAILRGYDMDGDDAIHAARALRSALHGFVVLELEGGFGLDVDVEASFSWLVDALAAMLAARPVPR